MPSGEPGAPTQPVGPPGARSARLKVLYVSTNDGGGPITHLRDLLPAVTRLGVDARVLCLDERVRAIFAGLGIDAVTMPVRHKFDVRGMAGVWPELDGVDVVHAQDRRAGLFALPLARLRRCRAVLTYHGLPDDIASMAGSSDGRVPAGVSPRRRLWLFRGLLPLESALARLGAVVVPSRALHDFLVGRGFPSDRLLVIPSGIDVRRTEAGAPHTPFVVATAAILEPRKGIDVLLDACARLTCRAHLDVYGEGSLRARLEERAAGLGLDVTFHGRVEGLRERLEQADVFVLPSWGENLPIAILEAMAAALPVVATRVGGNAELVVDGETGDVVEPGDPDGMARAIDRLADDPERRRAFARAAAARAAEHFDPDACAERLVALYRRLCDVPAPGPVLPDADAPVRRAGP